MSTAAAIPRADFPLLAAARRLVGLEFVAPRWREPLAFALRGWIACILALYVAFYLQLEAPYWAGMTVWMVAQPTPGMAISRAFYRVLGTLVGSVMGVVLMIFFAQTPELFIGVLALWIGATTVASNLLRNFRSYGTVLAGYTTAIIALGSYTHPEHTLETAFARGSATLIGIASAALVTSLLAPHRAYGRTRERLRLVLAQAARRCAVAPNLPLAGKLAVGAPLVVELIALDTEIEFAAAESPEFRLHVRTARSLLAHLFGAIAAKRSMDARRARTGEPEDPALREILAEADRLLEVMSAGPSTDEGAALARSLERCRLRLAAIHPEQTDPPSENAISTRIIADRLDDMLEHLAGGLEDWAGLDDDHPRDVFMRLNFHRDHRIAFINGVRAFLAVAAAGAFWIASAWPSGTGFVIQTGVACSLFSSQPSPYRVTLFFMVGALIALPVAFVVNFFLLQNVTGFPLFALVLGLVLVPAALFYLNPRTTGISLAFCVNFLIVSRPTNPMNYDVVSFWNNAIATLSGVACGVLSYQLFLPPDPPAARRYVIHRIRHGLGRIASLEHPIPPAWAWQTRMFDRISRLHDPANLSSTPTDEWFEGGLAATELGNEILRLRFLLRDEPLTENERARALAVLAAVSRWKAEPTRVKRAVRTARQTMSVEPWPAATEARSTWLRLRGIFEEMEAFFAEHPRFLTL